jgi:hypothetical protein
MMKNLLLLTTCALLSISFLAAGQANTGSHPARKENFEVGGGYSDTDGGLSLDSAGNMDMSKTLQVGVDDATTGTGRYFGNATTEGGTLELKNSALEDSIYEWYRFSANGEHIELIQNVDTSNVHNFYGNGDYGLGGDILAISADTDRSIFPTGITTLDIGAVASTLNLGATSTGTTTVRNDLAINGDTTQNHVGVSTLNVTSPNDVAVIEISGDLAQHSRLMFQDEGTDGFQLNYDNTNNLLEFFADQTLDEVTAFIAEATGIWTFNFDTTFVKDITVDTDTLHVDSTNHRVGIGTTSPTSVLHINDALPIIKMVDSDNNADVLLNLIQPSASFNINADASDALPDTEITFSVDDLERVVIDSSGNLDTTGDLTVGGHDLLFPNNAPASIQLQGTNQNFRFKSNGNVIVQIDEDNDGSNFFLVRANGTTTDLLEIDESGNHTIAGDTSIGGDLDVTGSATFDTGTTTSSTVTLGHNTGDLSNSDLNIKAGTNRNAEITLISGSTSTNEWQFITTANVSSNALRIRRNDDAGEIILNGGGGTLTVGGDTDLGGEIVQSGIVSDSTASGATSVSVVGVSIVKMTGVGVGNVTVTLSGAQTDQRVQLQHVGGPGFTIQLVNVFGGGSSIPVAQGRMIDVMWAGTSWVVAI